MSNILSVKNLSFKYGATEVLSDINFDVEAGDYVALAGPNGAGKTTLIKIILGFLENYSGEIKLFGTNINHFKDWSRVGFLPQKSNTFNPLFPATVEEIVRLGLLSTKNFPKVFSQADEKKITEALKVLNIENLKHELLSKLSGGQQQRVFLARAIVSSPDLLVLDEPSTALDPKVKEDFFDLLKMLNAQKGTSIILITHDIAQMGQYAGKFLYLDKRLEFYGSFDDFCHSEKMSRFFGSHSQHLICHRHD